MSRRKFLAGSAAAGLTLWLPRHARGSEVWGDLHPESWPGTGGNALPTGGYKVLEIFAYGGLSPWETFYVDDDSWRAQRGFFDSLRDACRPDVPVTQSFGDLGTRVQLGWPTSPLWFRSGVVDNSLINRMRVVVLRHDLLPHEAAIPFSLTGLALGNPRQAGSAAVIGRRAMALAPDRFPASCVLMPDRGVASDNFVAAASVGQLDPAAAPLVLTVGGDGGLSALLSRGGDDARAASRDRLAAAYAGSYEARLTVGPDRLRSANFDQYEVIRQQLGQASGLATMLEGIDLGVADEAACSGAGASAPALDSSGAAIQAATGLLNQENGPRYVGVVDIGFELFGGAGYDSHYNNHLAVGRDFYRALEVLEQEIAGGTLDLDDTMVVLSTEFGRTPHIGVEGDAGRDHWPFGYVSVLLGGPVGRGGVPAQGYVGRIGGDGRAVADDSYTPADLRAAIYMAAGLNPLQPSEVFSIGDLSSNAREGSRVDEVALQNLAGKFFGV